MPQGFFELAVAPDRKPPCSRGCAGTPLNCPQAARMSAPLRSRVIVWIPAAIRMSRKRSTEDGGGTGSPRGRAD